jgi:hypothetical protein
MDLYILSPICVHGIVLNYLKTGTTLCNEGKFLILYSCNMQLRMLFLGDKLREI